jgi:5-oxoprolinase (ATP-hydrolysing)
MDEPNARHGQDTIDTPEMSIDVPKSIDTSIAATSNSAGQEPSRTVLTGFEFCIDRGGTFTDVFCRTPTGRTLVMKLLSEDPRNYDDAPREAIRRILSAESGRQFAKGELIDAELIKSIRMGTTVATNALLERKGEPIALLITKGFRDLLYIGNQARPNIFDLRIDRPEVLYKEVVEVEERVLLRRDDCGLGVTGKVKVGQTGEEVVIETALDEKKLIQQLRRIKEQQIGSLAVALMHSYTYPDHEQLIKQLAIKLGFKHITLSSEVMPMVKLVQRGNTTCVDAYLTPHIHRYIHSFASGFRLGLHKLNVLFMQSDGGLAPVSTFSGCRAILSGPAGGVVGFTRTCIAEFGRDRRVSTALQNADRSNAAVECQADKTPKCAIIGFDMGGTSTDVYRYNGSELEHSYETSISGIPIQCPQLDITTVAAGGGSVLRVRNGLFVVGPESAGAYPGPICYRNYGNDLTVTDANVLLGRLLPEYFPAIFGPGKNESLNKEMVVMVFESLAEEIRCRNIKYSACQEQANAQRDITREEVALGFVRVANEAMCRAIRNITQGKGYDTSTHLLCCFGGAGAQHACSVARNLGIKKVFIHKYASILSAYGMGLANVVNEQQEPCNVELSEVNFADIDARFDVLKRKCREKLSEQGFANSSIDYELYLNMRYDKTDFALMVKPQSAIQPRVHSDAPEEQRRYCQLGDFRSSFIARYRQEFGFIMSADQPIMIDDIRVRGIGISDLQVEQDFDNDLGHVPIPQADSLVQCYFEQGYLETAVFKLEQLKPGMKVNGPVIIIDDNSTILVEPFCVLEITRQGNLLIHTLPGAKPSIDIRLDPILLSIFSHRFMSIAEQMGRVLQRTAISTNIKERMDFSCALFDQKGRLVSNAPHIPVHLGSMQEAVMYHLNRADSLFKEGDVILTNSPEEGGTHLPDLTVITPVFYRGANEPVFFVASRGHHADIGGLTPGSMPPTSTKLIEEGTEFCSFLLVKSGKFQLDDLIEKFKEPGKHPGLSGCRTIQDNINDLKAQVAANQKGISLVSDLIDYYGLDVVQAYMRYQSRILFTSICSFTFTILFRFFLCL